MLLLATLALQAPPDLSLSMTARVRVVAEEISRRAGLRLEVAKAIPDHAVVVALRDAPAEEALRRVAWAVYGRVEAEGDLRRIVPDTETINRAKREYRAWRIERNRKIAAALANQTEPSPGKRAVARLFSEFAPERWADYDPYHRPYSTHPNRMQLPMPGGFLQTYQAELNKAREKLDLEPVALTKALFTMGEVDRPILSFVAISAIKSGGGTVSEDHSTSFWTMVATSDLLPKAIPAAALEAMPKEETMEWSPATTAFLAAMLDEGDPVPKEAIDRLMAPARFDPQGYGVRDVFETLSRRMKASIVVNASDDAVFNVHIGDGKSLRDALRKVWTPFTRFEDGWVVDRPPVQKPEWAWQIDRHSLNRFLAARNDPRVDTYDARREFVAECGLRPTWVPLMTYVHRCVSHGEMAALLDPGISLLARLPAATRQHLASGGTLPTRSLPEAAQLTLWTRLDRMNPSHNAPSATDMTIFPSERFPNGLPPGELGARERLTPYLRIRGVSSNGETREDVISCIQYAAPSNFKMTSLEPLWSPVIEIRASFEGGWQWVSDVQRKYRSAGPAVASEEGLPQAHRTAIAQARASLGKG
ncbi:MAG: hypothetical protein ACO1SV_11010 [Fimbriimonas sp.]